jgi:hypothetical protein
LLGQVVEAPPQGITWQQLLDNGTLPNPGYEPGGGNYFELIGALVAVSLASLFAYTTIHQTTDTNDDNRTKPIVLDLGPSVNLDGEIFPLIAYYKPQGIKVVAVERDIFSLGALKFLQASMPEDFSVIQDSFTESDILSKNGYNCATAAFSLWPGQDYLTGQGFMRVPAALHNLVCSGGYVHVISEIPARFN